MKRSDFGIPRKDLTGKKFGRLTVLGIGDKKGKLYYRDCLCDCGTKIVVQGGHIKSLHTQSCGCLQKEIVKKVNTKHGMSYKSEYNTRLALNDRCYNQNNKSYKDYGGRGIVCKYSNFEEFYNDLGKKPSKYHSINRINNDGNYEKGNCEWSTSKEQSLNKRSNKNIKIYGQIKTLSYWLNRFNIKRELYYYRIRKGFTPKESILTPIGKKGESLKDRKFASL